MKRYEGELKQLQLRTGGVALGIEVESPQPTIGGEDLQCIARPEGKRPKH
jgi:hypothetical protein